MKKILLFTTCFILVFSVSAQYCGNSGSSQCTASGAVLQPGLSPMSDSLPPFVNNVASTTVIEFRNFNTVFFGGGQFTLQSLKLDSIENLPNGLCWASDKVNNTYANSENGCIKVNGTPCDSTGQYKLRIIATAVLTNGFTVQVDASSVGLHYYVRVINSGNAITPVDTLTTIPFVPYGGVCSASPPPVVNLGADQNVCSGSIATLNPVVTGGLQPVTYLWQSTGNSLSCSTCLNPTATLTQNSTYTVTVTDAAGNSDIDTIDYTVSGGAGNFQITANGATSLCRGSSVTLHAAQNASFANQWQRNGVDIIGEMDSTYTIADSSGAYSVSYSSGGCNATSNVITVTVSETPSVTVSPAGPVAVCQGSSITLQATATAGVTYLWQLNGSNLGTATTSSYSASAFGGSYRVVVKNASNCADTSNAIAVTINPLPSVTLSGNADTLCNTAASITLTGGSPSGGTYSGIGITGNSFNPGTSGTGTHTIAYTYIDGNTCTNSATETIVVRLCTGINDLEESLITIYPNPANKQLIVTADLITDANTTFRICDITGKVTAAPFKYEGHQISFNIASLQAGMYWIKLNIQGKEVSKKFIKVD